MFKPKWLRSFIGNEEESTDDPAELLRLVNEVSNLKNENTRLESLVQGLEKGSQKIAIDIEIKDPIPEKMEARKSYVTEVAGFHKEYLHNKLMYMIHSIHLLIEGEENSIHQDRMLKGAIYGFRELDRWGDMMVSESIGNVKENIGTED